MRTEQRLLLLKLYQQGKDSFTKTKFPEDIRKTYITNAIAGLIKLKTEIDPNDDDISLLYGSLWLLYLHQKDSLEAEKYYQLLIPLFKTFKEKFHIFTDLYSDVMKTYAWKMLKIDKNGAKQLLTEIIASEADQSAKKWAQSKLSFFNKGNNGQADEKNIDKTETKEGPSPVELSKKNQMRLKELDRLADVMLECNPDKIVSVLSAGFSKTDEILQFAMGAAIAFLKPMLNIIKLMNAAVIQQNGIPKEVRQEFYALFRQVNYIAQSNSPNNLQDIAILKVAIKFFNNYQDVWSKDHTGGFNTTLVYVKGKTPAEDRFSRTSYKLQMKELNEALNKKISALAREDKKTELTNTQPEEQRSTYSV